VNTEIGHVNAEIAVREHGIEAIPCGRSSRGSSPVSKEPGNEMERLTMSRTREILRIRWQLGLSVRETSRATGASVGVVSKTESRA